MKRFDKKDLTNISEKKPLIEEIIYLQRRQILNFTSITKLGWLSEKSSHFFLI